MKEILILGIPIAIAFYMYKDMKRKEMGEMDRSNFYDKGNHYKIRRYNPTDIDILIHNRDRDNMNINADSITEGNFYQFGRLR